MLALSLPSKPFLPLRHLHPISAASSARPPPPSPSLFPNSAVLRIAEKLRSLGFVDAPRPPPPTGPGSPGEIFIPTPNELPNRRVGHTLDSSWSTPDSPVPVPGSGLGEMNEGKGRRKKEDEKAPMAAEMLIGADELRRLRKEGIAERKRLKIGKAGITEGVVNGIHERWRRAEVVKIRCEDLCRMNMKRTHEMLERKTGGLVIWRSGSVIILYRGDNYTYPYFMDDGHVVESSNVSSAPVMASLSSDREENAVSTREANTDNSLTKSLRPLVMGVGSPKKLRFQLPGEAILEAEADQLLDGLGPRFTDWWGYEPLPVDADLLPAIVPGFRRPFRLLPYGMQPKLTDREMTTLRRLARPLPCHFALGRNRNLQGLAASIIKLWERCEIAKIAIKRGVQNMNSELMAEELKQLTGGTLLSRDKDFIAFYRGKDFLPLAVSHAIEERRNDMLHKNTRTIENSSMATACSDPGCNEPVMSKRFQEANGHSFDSEGKGTSKKPLSKSIEIMLSRAIAKKMKAEKLLEELEESKEPKLDADKESISEEEKYMMRRIGLRMKPFLLLGRRGAFDGTVENMHLHWKYRELVKVISKDRSVEEVRATARTLEAASGGILVAVERVNKGYAIIVYRGKNYSRPASLRPQTLLNKREAYKRYLESQRRKSLKLHVLKLDKDIEQMNQKLVNRDKGVDDQSTKFNSSDVLCGSPDNSSSIQYADKGSANELTDKMDVGPIEGIAEVKAAKIHTNSCSPKGCSEDAEPAGGVAEVDATKSYLSSFSTHGSCSEDEGSGNICFSASISQDETLDVETACDMFPISKEGLPSISEIKNICIHDKTSSKEALKDYVDEDENNMHLEFCGSSKASALSNKERLILRKQALKMRNRPVLAVGRNNIVTGVAKAIKVHFRKHPLAIVNIKGIAKGTSVQEVIFELERATGAMLVSREPSKVILYRGWGEGETPSASGKERSQNASASASAEDIPPKLLRAIRIESGLFIEREEEALNADEQSG